jgi:phosphotransferase system HPr (HPr) family protein
MKTIRVRVQQPGGLHLREATRLARLAQRFHSRILLRLGTRLADARSVLSLLILSAGLGAALDVEATGLDEVEAVQAVGQFFADPPDAPESP